jgi:hypothetical protein
MGIELVVFDIAGTTVKDSGRANEFFRKLLFDAEMQDVRKKEGS